MKSKPAIWSLVTLAVVATLAAAPAAVAAPASTAIRIDTASSAAFNGLGITAMIDIDYGSFRWLVLTDVQLAELAASGIKFTTAEEAGTVRVMDYRFDPVSDGEPALPDRMLANPQRPGLRFLQTTGPVKDEWIAELKRQGITLLQYYPHNTFLVWAGPGVLEEAESLPYVRWHGLFHPAYKINSNLEAYTGVIQNVDVMFYNDGHVDSTLENLEKFGAVVLQHYPSQPDKKFFNAIVEIDADAIDGISRIPTVLWAGYAHPEPIFDDEMSDQIIADNHPGGVPVVGYNPYLTNLGFDGTGVTWATIDTGVDYAHPDLNTRIAGGYGYPGAPTGAGPGDDCSGGGHGTHVSGIIGGDATGAFTDPAGFLYGLGVAPGVSFFASNSLCAPSWPPAGGWQEHSKQAVLGNAIGGNNSWTTSEGTQHGYQASERTHDLMVRDGNFDTDAFAEPFIEVFSAGNSGSSGLTSPKEGKNLIVTAASVNYRAGNIDTIASFSSRGPAVDGRIVPTIAAPGDDIASSMRQGGASQCTSTIGGTNGLYSLCSGTSMAAPHTSGVIALATQWWRVTESALDPSPAMAKALLVNSADDMGTPDIPNNNEGWGRINIETLINPSVTRVYRDQDHVFGNTGEQLVIALGVPDPAEPLKITIAWSDAPGAVGANPALVNNLDLQVSTGGTTYLGNVFSGGWSTSGGSPDAINNLENVYVQNPGGDAIITIDATAIVGDGIPYNADTTDQDFAIVCSNCALEADFYLGTTPNSQSICAPADAIYAINVGAILAFDEPVILSTTGEPAGTSVGFSPNPVTPLPGASTMTISNTGAAAAGAYTVEITGTSPSKTHMTSVDLNLSTAVPSAPALVSPANGAANQSARPTFEWTAASQAEGYAIQVATNRAFTNLVIDESGLTDTDYTHDSDLMTNASYWWRVGATNACGDGSWSAGWSFTTLAAPGDCGIGTTTMIHFSDDFETGAPGWTTGGIGSTWALGSGVSGSGPHSGTFVYHGDDVDEISDQHLISPAIALPSGPDHTAINLQFWNYQELEDFGTSACFDGGLLEISTDGGSNWTQLATEVMQTDPYDGPIDDGWSNPLQNLDAWCGDPQDWLESIVDINAYAGETVQFRFRLGTDSSVDHPGWDIDDVVVQSCVPVNQEPIFSDDFESGDTSAWSGTNP